MRRSILLLAAVLIVAGGCDLIAPQRAGALRELHIENGTTRGIVVRVDGRVVATVGSRQSAVIAALDVPAVRFEVRVSLEGGREVGSAILDPGVVTATADANGQGSAAGTGTRIDLSCGRIDVWMGTPMLGPPPGPGVPGDCS